MDTRVLLICGLAAGFLMVVAAFAGSIDMARTRMVVAKAPICRPSDKPPGGAQALGAVLGVGKRTKQPADPTTQFV